MKTVDQLLKEHRQFDADLSTKLRSLRPMVEAKGSVSVGGSVLDLESCPAIHISTTVEDAANRIYKAEQEIRNNARKLGIEPMLFLVRPYGFCSDTGEVRGSIVCTDMKSALVHGKNYDSYWSSSVLHTHFPIGEFKLYEINQEPVLAVGSLVELRGKQYTVVLHNVQDTFGNACYVLSDLERNMSAVPVKELKGASVC